MIRVVAAVIVRARSHELPQVLACRRTGPPELAGLWEFPGGKVEPGETDEVAVRREISEELLVEIVLHGPLGGELPMVGGHGVWQPYVATVIAGEPQRVDHDELRWLTAGQLHDIPWLASDVPVMTDVEQLLAQVEAGSGPASEATR